MLDKDAKEWVERTIAFYEEKNKENIDITNELYPSYKKGFTEGVLFVLKNFKKFFPGLFGLDK